ncbi:putative laccase-9 isoform X2 [Quercus robur]|nr:putative laccase-9 isoform X2 [Quercus robur]
MGLKNMDLGLAFLGYLFLDGLFLCIAAEHEITFDLREKVVTSLCNKSESLLLVNESYPGPTLRVRKGDTAYITVNNNGLYGLTVHWHGVKQPKNPWSDGPEYITQCPIQPGNSFTYKVIFSDEEGTLWWHAHSDWTRATVYGAIVVEPAKGKLYPFDKQPDGEHIIILGEWYNGYLRTMLEAAMRIGADVAPSDAYTINGQPGFSNDCYIENITIFEVARGNTYLLRIVSAVMNEEMFFGIAGHNITVVGQDGAYLKPIPTSYIMISPGQTMDVLVTANNSIDGHTSYYMVATPYSDSGGAPFNEKSTSAVLNYGGLIYNPLYPEFLPDPKNTDAADAFTKQIKTLATEEHPIDVPQEIDERIFITISVNQLPCNLPEGEKCGGPGGNMHASTLNNISFQNPSVDILQAYYWNLTASTAPPLPFDTDFPAFPPVPFNYTAGDNAQYQFPSLGTKVRMIEYGQRVEIVFQGTNIGNPENHPIHLHGYSFYVVGRGHGNFDTDPNYKHDYNLVDPPRVNTIGVPKNGWVAIRFKADNPGVWFMHCHLEKHAIYGMAGVLIVKDGDNDQEKMLPPPKDGMPKC